MDRKEIAWAVGRMQAYVAEHLNEPITLLELARCAGYSPYYAARIFKDEPSGNPRLSTSAPCG